MALAAPPAVSGHPRAPEASLAGTYTPAPARARRLSAAEINNSLRDIFYVGKSFSTPLPADGAPGNFDNQFENVTVPPLFLEQLGATAQKVAEDVKTNIASLLPCDATKVGTCINKYLDTIGTRVFRRPLREDERNRYRTLYDKAHELFDHPTAIAAVTEALVQSPYFLFRTELGGNKQLQDGKVTLTSYELAAALSYSLWRSTPDDQLLELASRDMLQAPGELAKQTQRLLESERAKGGLSEFFLQWLDLGLPETLTKDDPMWSQAFAASLVDESRRFFESTVFGTDPHLKALFTSSKTFANRDVAKIYGLPNASALGTSSFDVVQLDPAVRSGFFTQPAFIAAHTRGEFSPVFLGAFVRSKLLCQTLPPPPPGASAMPPRPDATPRERYAQHSQSEACRSCHTLMDPVGFAFERFDVLGRDKEMSLTGEGELTESDVDGVFKGVPALAKRLLSSQDVRECVAGQLLKYVLGRETASIEARRPSDQALLTSLEKGAFKDGNFLSLIIAIVQSETFRVRTAIVN